MTSIGIVVRKEMAEILGQKKNLAGIILSPLLMVGVMLFAIQSLIDSVGQIIPLSLLIPRLLDLYGFNYTISLIPMISSVITADMFIAEKMRKSIEVTLTTPVQPNDILLGKTIAAFALSYPVSVASFFIVAAFLWARYGLYLPSVYTLLYIVTLLPVIAILLLSLIGVLQLSTRYYKAANSIFFLAMMLTIFIPSFFVSEMPEAGDLFVVYGLVCASLGLVVGRLIRGLLNKEKIVTTGG